MNEKQFRKARREMVNQQLKPRGITDANVLKAMQQTPREKFVPETFRKQSYKDGPLPIGYDQTISQPYVVALMCQLAELKGHETVLDVGTGTGYQAAVLAHLAKKVISIERINELCHKARNNLAKAHCDNVTVYQCNARDDQALISAYHFDVIVCAASSKTIPSLWKSAINICGRIIMPIGDSGWLMPQKLVKAVKIDSFKTDNEALFEYSYQDGVAFVPLI